MSRVPAMAPVPTVAMHAALVEQLPDPVVHTTVDGTCSRIVIESPSWTCAPVGSRVSRHWRGGRIRSAAVWHRASSWRLRRPWEWPRSSTNGSRRACRDIPGLRAAIGSDLRVSVNISARHLSDTDLPQRVIGALSAAGVGGGTLMLEITETALMGDPDNARSMIEELKAYGVRIAIDDFGTGYGSLSYLSRLPVDTLKIHRTFIEHSSEQQDAMSIAASVVDLARGLRLNAVAEGVETEEQARLLHRLGCPEAQGWLWSRALPLAELVSTVRSLPGGVFRRAIEKPHRTPRTDKRGVATADHGLHEIVRLHREGASPASIAAALNAEGYRTPEDQKWHRATVARVINDTAYPELFGTTSRPAAQASDAVRRLADR